jgi:hypothetical protein
MKHFALIVVAAALAILGFAAVGVAAPPEGGPPGQGECGHGNSQKPCKEDPQPDKGKDCEEHGNQGGVNEDHCKGETQPPTETEPTTPEETTPTTPTTPEETTPSTPTETTSTPTETTPGSSDTPVDSPESPSSSSPEEQFEEQLEQQVVKQAKANGATPESQSSSTTTGSQTRATEALPYTGLPVGWMVALGTGLVASGLALRGDLSRLRRRYWAGV